MHLCKKSIPLILIMVASLSSCDKKPSGQDDTATHLLNLSVVDTAGKPVQGLRVGSINYSPYITYAKPNHADPETQLEYSLSSPALIELNILNYYKQVIRHLFREVKPAGTFRVYWDALDDEGVQVRSGYYYYSMTAKDTTGAVELITMEKPMLFELGKSPSSTLIGTTDKDGIYFTDDTLILPCLLGNPPEIIITDGAGSVIDTVKDFYADSVIITLSDLATPGKFMYFDKALKREPNEFQLIWDPSKAE